MNNQNTKKKVLVAMSGGVDSSVAALLLKEQGYDVSGAYMRCWPEMREGIPCTSPKDNIVALQVAAHLDISFQTFNFEQEYRDTIFQYFLDEYKAGRTPNPDVMCNKYIKFGFFLKKALELGYDFVATGHYVRKIDNSLFKAVDSNKDQSYFLCQLTQEQLQYALFPIGKLTKSEVREIAKKYGLPNADKKDSQGLCFVGHIELPKVLERFMKLENGPIANSQCSVIGEHIGLNAYTIGQRSHLNIGGTGPWYVADKDYITNTLVVAKETDSILYKDTIKLAGVNLVRGDMPEKVNVKLRYRQPDVPAIIEKTNDGWIVKLQIPQKGVAPGQFLVFYQGDQLLGGGVIDLAYNANIVSIPAHNAFIGVK